MLDVIALLVLIAQSAASSHSIDYNCTTDLDRPYGGNLRSEMTAIDTTKPLNYASTNHRHFHDVSFDSRKNRLPGLELRSNERIVIVFETEGPAATSNILDHGCHVFFDFP